MPFAWADGDMAGDLLAAGFDVLALSPQGTERLSDVKPAGRTAVLFGAEGPGLPEAVLARCRTVRIPMAGSMDSLNVAAASAIVLERLTNG